MAPYSISGMFSSAFTTDCYVVHPLFFLGGDIGALAVNGTVNDLAMCGAQPLYLSVGLVLEEGLPLTLLRRVVASMQKAAADAGVTGLSQGIRKSLNMARATGSISPPPALVWCAPTSLRPPIMCARVMLCC